MQLLTAMYQSGKAVILNLPFEPISSTWREKYASYLVEQCEANNKIIVVVNMDYRPESWVENPSILRVQLGEDVHKTIGFGTSASGVQDLIDNIRSSIKDDEKLGDALDRVQEEARPRPASEDRDRKVRDQIDEEIIPPLIDPNLVTKWLKPAAACMLALLATLVYLTTIKVSVETPSAVRANVVKPKPAADKTKPPAKDPIVKVKQGDIKRPPISPNIVDLYPAKIKDSLLKALDTQNPPFAKRVSPSKSHVKKSSVNQQAAGLLNALQGLSGTGDNIPSNKTVSRIPSAPLSSSSSMSIKEREERREMIRQKFLEAIKKASTS